MSPDGKCAPSNAAHSLLTRAPGKFVAFVQDGALFCCDIVSGAVSCLCRPDAEGKFAREIIRCNRTRTRRCCAPFPCSPGRLQKSPFGTRVNSNTLSPPRSKRILPRPDRGRHCRCLIHPHVMRNDLSHHHQQSRVWPHYKQQDFACSRLPPRHSSPSSPQADPCQS